jgi:stage V sporulation protein B
VPIAKPSTAPLTQRAAGSTVPVGAEADGGSRFLGSVLAATATAGTGIVLAMLLGAARQVVVGRSLGPSGLGVVGLAESVETLLIRVAPLGLTASLPLLVSRQLGEGRADAAGRYLATGTVLGLVLAIAAAGIMAAAAIPLSSLAADEATRTTLLAWSLVVLGLTACQVLASGLRGLLAIPASTAVRDVLPNLLVLVLAVIGLVAGVRLPGLALFYGAGALVAAGIGFLALRRVVTAGDLEVRVDRSLLRPLLALSLPVLLMAASGQLIRQVNVPMLAAATDLATVGLFTVGLFFATSVEGVFIALTLVYMPLASRALVAEGREAVAARQAAVARWTYLATLVPVLVLAAATEEVVDVLFGPAYRGAATAIRILAVGLLVQAAIGPRNSVLLALDRARDVTATFLVALVVVVVTSVALIPAIGLNGAAISFAAGTVVRSVLSLVFLARELPQTRPTLRASTALLVAPVCAIGPLVLAGWAGIALAVAAGGATLALLFGRVDELDRSIVRAAARRARVRR